MAEVLGGGFSAPVDPAKEAAIFAVLDNPDAFTLVQVTRQVASIARDLRRELHLEVADSVHLATATFAGAERFVTMNENDFPVGETVRGVKVRLPSSALGAEVLPPAIE